MENTDNTLLEMQEQMRQLRKKLESQEIVSDRFLRDAMTRKKNFLKFKASVPVFCGIAGIAFIPYFFENVGLPLWLIILTTAMLLVAIVASIIARSHLPRFDRDLLSATKELTRFRRINAEWIKYGLPSLVVWLGLLIWQITVNTDISRHELYGIIGGIAIGLIIGVSLGLKNRRDILSGTDELLEQIEELKLGE